MWNKRYKKIIYNRREKNTKLTTQVQKSMFLYNIPKINEMQSTINK